MARDDSVVGLDIGTTKVCTVVGHGDAQGKITILGVGVVPSRGVTSALPCSTHWRTRPSNSPASTLFITVSS